MPPPVAVSRDVPAPTCPHRTPGDRARRPGPSTSLAHVARLVRAAVPPMHPGGRPIVAAVAAAAASPGSHRPRRARRCARHRRDRRLLPRPAPRPAVARRVSCCRRRRHGRARRRRRAPARAGPATRAGAAGERVPVGLDVHVQRIPADGRVRRRRAPAGPVPVGGPRQGQRGQRAHRAAAGDHRRRPRRRRADRRAGGAAHRLRRRARRRGRGGGDLRPDPVRLAGRHLPAGGHDGPVEVGQRTVGGETVLAELPGAPCLGTRPRPG